MNAAAHIAATLACDVPDVLTPPFMERLRNALEDVGARDLSLAWHREPFAADIDVRGLDEETVFRVLKGALGPMPVDVIAQKANKRVKKLLVADMESTIIEQEMLDELAARLGLREKVSDITRRGMNGDIDFTQSLRERTLLLKGQTEAMLREEIARITFSRGAAELVAFMKKQGARCWLVSGGFDIYARHVAEALGFDHYMANAAIVRQNVLTGELRDPVLDGHGKAAALRDACKHLGLSLDECLVVGDGANDLPMLTLCEENGGLAVAYKAKPKVTAAIRHHIDYSSLATLACAQSVALP